MYLTDKMAVVAPNLSALFGDTVAARLISKVRVSTLAHQYSSPDSTLHLAIFLSTSYTGRLSDKLGKSSRVHHPDSWHREGIVP